MLFIRRRMTYVYSILGGDLAQPSHRARELVVDTPLRLSQRQYEK